MSRYLNRTMLTAWLLALTTAVLVACSNPSIGGRTGGGAPAGALFYDDFLTGETGPWHLETDEQGATTVANSQLLITVNAANTIQYATLREPEFDNFTLEIDARQLSGSPESSYGVLFRMRSPEEFYRFEITGDGSYMLERRSADGRWMRFIDDWRASEAINPGLNTLNRLKVEARGPVISVYVNDTLLLQANDNAYASGLIALDAGTFGQPGLEVGFDKVVVMPVAE